MKLILTEEEKLDILEQYMGKSPRGVKQGMDFSGKLSNIKSGESWFYQNKCLQIKYPSLKPTGGFASLKLSNGDTISFESNGTYTYKPKPIYADTYLQTHDERIKRGKWWCDSNNEVKIDTEPKKDFSVTTSIQNASTMEDVKLGRGYIIKNMKGPVVKELQKLLIDSGYLNVGQDDSIFGDNTYNAVVKLQKDLNVVPKNNIYGTFGIKTYNALMNKLKESGK